MLQYKVPQNIRMPDQIIGPLTLEQFLYLLFGSAFVYMAYLYIGEVNTIFWVLSIPISLISLAFAFVPVNEQPFSRFIGHLILFLARGKVLTWQQLPPPIMEFGMQQSQEDKNKEKAELMHPEEVVSQLQQLSLVLDTQVKPLRTPEEATASAPVQPAPTHAAPIQPAAPETKPVASAEPSVDTNLKPEKKSFFGQLFNRQPSTPTAPQEIMQKQSDAKKAAIEVIMQQQKKQ